MTGGRSADVVSCFYEGTVRHRRRRPTPHAFRYRVFLVYVDLAELESLFGRPGLWSSRRPSIARFAREDYLGDPRRSLDGCVRELVRERAGFSPTGPIRLLTHFRYLEFAMNPVSFFYCFNPGGEKLEALVADVTNTPWGERYAYVLDLRGAADAGRARTAKAFHVSPFLSMDLQYHWRLRAPGRSLGLHIEATSREGSIFDATLHLRRRELSSRNKWFGVVRYPLSTLVVFLRIYWQALRLWMKGTPYVPHPKRLAAALEASAAQDAFEPRPSHSTQACKEGAR
jgi:DUF1365 family protein